MSTRAVVAVILTAACASAAPRSPSDGGPAGTAAPQARSNRPPHSPADVHFMAGMIVHHAQAVLIAGWSPTHGASPAVRTLSERIVVAQRDEIELMQRWLEERGERVPEPDPRGYTMPGMDHPVLMPGMLTAEQLAQLDGARGAEFDRLFLTYMIMHHRGAITMVEQLFGAQGATQDGLVFRFAADVNADQAAEIDRMTRMLEALTRSPM